MRRAVRLPAWLAIPVGLALGSCATTPPFAPAAEPGGAQLAGPGLGPSAMPVSRPEAATGAQEAVASARVSSGPDGGGGGDGDGGGDARCTAWTGARALKRSALNRVLDAGLGTWLGGVDVEPKVVRGRFGGWLLRSLHAEDPCWAEVDLRPGDVVSRVNHHAIEKPEQAHAVWSALRQAREISVDFVRAGQSRTLTFAVADDPPTRGAARSASAP